VRRLAPLLLLLACGCASPLGRAASRGDVLEVKRLINEGADLDRRDANAETALMKAAKEGQAAAIEALLDAGADTEVESPAGTALELAALYKRKDAVRALLEGGARPTARAYDLAVQGGRRDIAELIGARVGPDLDELRGDDVQPGRSFTTGVPDARELEKMLRR
jgi:ankyrin repeat protein